MGHGGDSDPNYNWCARNNPQKNGKGTRRLGNKRTSGNHLDYNITKIGQDIEKSPGDVLSQTTV